MMRAQRLMLHAASIIRGVRRRRRVGGSGCWALGGTAGAGHVPAASALGGSARQVLRYRLPYWQRFRVLPAVF